jgi:23S rRNA (cytidine2498-2'-O)-methyltransferase
MDLLPVSMDGAFQVRAVRSVLVRTFGRQRFDGPGAVLDSTTRARRRQDLRDAGWCRNAAARRGLMDAAPAVEWILACRPGFEGEAAAEGRLALAAHGVPVTEPRIAPGLVRFAFDGPIDRGRLPDPHRLIFARTAWPAFARLSTLDPRDRLTPLLAALDAVAATVGDVWVETADGEEGTALAGFARSFEAATLAALKRARRLDPSSQVLLRVLAASGADLALALDDRGALPPSRGGIPRLRLPRDAPSRSALKIEEAWLTLLSASERVRALAPGMTAVDLGAAPGGWSWQLARRGLAVTAIDNGPLAASALATGRIRHVRADGFRFRPPRPVDWLVCDMVEQPARVARLVADWLARGDAHAALVNLKLPMKKRWEETVGCLVALGDAIDALLPPSVAAAAARPDAPVAGTRFALRARQLYHDREEITVLALPLGRRTRRGPEGRPGPTSTAISRRRAPRRSSP